MLAPIVLSVVRGRAVWGVSAPENRGNFSTAGQCESMAIDKARACKTVCRYCDGCLKTGSIDAGLRARWVPAPSVPSDLLGEKRMVEFEDLNHPGCERTMRVEPSETERLYDLVMSGTDEDGKSWSTKARPIATGVEDSDSDDEYFFVADFPAAKNSGSSMLMGRLASDKSAVVWGDGNAWTALNGTARGCDRCVDRGPWPCHEEGCPSNEVDCGTLLHAGACLYPFSKVWKTPPAGLERGPQSYIFMQCLRTCGVCTAEERGKQLALELQKAAHAAAVAADTAVAASVAAFGVDTGYLPPFLSAVSGPSRGPQAYVEVALLSAGEAEAASMPHARRGFAILTLAVALAGVARHFRRRISSPVVLT